VAVVVVPQRTREPAEITPIAHAPAEGYSYEHYDAPTIEDDLIDPDDG